jgi:hypothetical protein
MKSYMEEVQILTGPPRKAMVLLVHLELIGKNKGKA